MKPYQLITMAFILTFSTVVMADNCDQACWQKRYYELQKQQIVNQQKRFDSMMKEKEMLRKQQQILRKEKEQQQKAELRQKLIMMIHNRCAKEDMNKATFAEKSLCSVINGHFKYGMEVPDSMLGLNG